MIPVKKILVVDDEKKITEAISAYLEKEGFIVECAGSGTEALELFRKSEPSLVILDLMLPDIPGETVCRTIRKSSRIPIIMLTAKVEEKDLLGGFVSGTDDYMTKPFSPRELVARVKAVLKRISEEPFPLSSFMSFRNGELEIDSEKHEVKKLGLTVRLTNHEFRILATLVAYPQRVFSREELARNAFGSSFEGFDRTIDAHIKNLRYKIEPDPKNPCYVITVYGVGYKFEGNDYEIKS
jgi:DNA-binding response OmpR family regulator